MSDLALLREVLRQIEEAIKRIERRFTGIQSAEDFIITDEGIDKLDSIAMMLIWMGESIKNLEKYGGKELLAAYPDVDWKGAKGTRDILSHHYGDVDAEVVFDICDRYIPSIKMTIEQMKQDVD
ncbi:MAG: DUF86 domain-containing protein [Leptolyngbyaceae cyanobacterium]